MTTPTEKKSEARKGLMDARSNFATVEDMDKALDAFAAACVAEALQPREQSPELAEAERLMRQGVHFVGSNLIIADELDRLRAEVARLSEFARAVRMADKETGGSAYFSLAVTRALSELDKASVAVPPRKAGT